MQLDYYILQSPAARSLSGNAFKVLLYLMMRFNGVNNGSISFGSRSGCFTKGPTGGYAEVDIGLSKSSITRALDELQEHGFLRCSQPSSFGQKRLTRNWRLTFLRDPNGVDSMLPTKEFTTFNPALKKQKAGPRAVQRRLLQAHGRGSEKPDTPENGSCRLTGGTIDAIHRPTGGPHIVTIPCDVREQWKKLRGSRPD